jgi:hypothetical protein
MANTREKLDLGHGWAAEFYPGSASLTLYRDGSAVLYEVPWWLVANLAGHWLAHQRFPAGRGNGAHKRNLDLPTFERIQEVLARRPDEGDRQRTSDYRSPGDVREPRIYRVLDEDSVLPHD